MREAVLIDDESIESLTAGLLADVLMNLVRPKVLHGDGVVDGLAAGLDGERIVGITELQALALDCADAQAPIFRRAVCQLRNISRILAVVVCLALFEHLLDLLREVREFRDQQVVIDNFQDELEVRVRTHVLASKSGAQLCSGDHIGHRLEMFDHVADSWVVAQDSKLA